MTALARAFRAIYRSRPHHGSTTAPSLDVASSRPSSGSGAPSSSLLSASQRGAEPGPVKLARRWRAKGQLGKDAGWERGAIKQSKSGSSAQRAKREHSHPHSAAMGMTEDTGRRSLAAAKVSVGSLDLVQSPPSGRLFVGASGSVGFGISSFLRLVRTAVLLTLFATSMLALPSPASADSCPNEVLRQEQGFTELPNCRAYEKVSPADKGQGDIVGDGETNIASPSGDAITMSSRTPFGDTIASGVSGQTQYVARRTADAWVTHAVTPRSRAEAYQTFFVPTLLQTYSDDLRTVIVWGYDLPDVSGDVPLHNNIYVEDTATRSLEAVTGVRNGLPSSYPPFFVFLDLQNNAIWGVSADARHLAFVSQAAYLPGAVSGVPNAYQWDNGVLSLAGILPNGSIPPGGSDIEPSLYRQSMSADGSRLLFTASDGGNRQLYMRINGTRTVQISETEIRRGDPGYNPDPGAVTLKAMTADGRNVLFTTNTPLRSEDRSGGETLYRWTDSADPARDDNLTVIAPGGGEVPGVSNDAQRIYYQTGGNELGVWDHGTTQLISAQVPISSLDGQRLGVTAQRPGLGRVTPDGRYFAFSTSFSDAGIGPTGDVTNGHFEMYFYDLAARTLRCISCPSGGATSDVTVGPRVTDGTPSYAPPGVRPRFLSDSGHVFFSSAEALVPQDRNGVYDTYDYDPATDSLSLISSGKGSNPATFTDASASGDDVFFVTRQSLVGSDHDNLVDLYDARAGGGFPEEQEPSSSPCLDEVCQGFPSSAPIFQTPTSVSLTSPGNVKPFASKKKVSKSSSKSQKLKRALRACKAQHKKAKRKKCESSAHRRFGKSGGSK